MNAVENFCHARFGIFFHWGLYAIPGGIWKGEQMEEIGEWIQSRFQIPNAEYAKLAEQFNPVKFDADEWIRSVRNAGANYIVYTTKHHDGFAMYHSKVDPYNIVEATPFGRDPLMELAGACRKHGVKLGIYYSHYLDWHHHDGGDPGPEVPWNNYCMPWGNCWDFPDFANKCFERCFEEKAIPQITELMSNYGEIFELWCDCAMGIEAKYSQRLREVVKKLQPDCMINSRIGNDCHDFLSLGDNQIMNSKSEVPVESPVTLNDTWGFKYADGNWKSAREIAWRIASLSARNANCLLNIGPCPDGSFPKTTVKRLEELAVWNRENGNAFTHCTPTPFKHEPEWGCATVQGNTLNLFVKPEFRQVALRGIEVDKIKSANVPFRVEAGEVVLEIPESDSILPVVKLTFSAPPDFLAEISPEKDIHVFEPASARIVHGIGGEKSILKGLDEVGNVISTQSHSFIRNDGALSDWHNPSDKVEWNYHIDAPGEYLAEVLTVSSVPRKWRDGREVAIHFDDELMLNARLEHGHAVENCMFPKVVSVLGKLKIAGPKAGKISLKTIKSPENFPPETCFLSLRLRKI